MENKRKAPCTRSTKRKEYSGHVHFQVNSKVFERVQATFTRLWIYGDWARNQDVLIKVTSMSNLDAAICSMRFELCEVKKDLKEQVTMHLYPGTRNIVVKGQLGQLDRILLGKKPFLCFEDVFLGPLVAGEDVVWGR